MMSNLLDISKFSYFLGSNNLFVQGAGGNISYKEGHSIWVKASGYCLKDALNEDIFINLDIPKILDNLQKNIDDFSDAILERTLKKPSIETAFHVLLPHSIVVHYHPIDVLAYAILLNGQSLLNDILKNINWEWVEYVKPGVELSVSINKKYMNNPGTQVFVLENHGVILVGNSLDEIVSLHHELHTRLNKIDFLHHCNSMKCSQLMDSQIWEKHGYILQKDELYQHLAFNSKSQFFINHAWAINPDHILFLGEKPMIFEENSDIDLIISSFNDYPSYLIFKNMGVLTHKKFTQTQKEYLNSYTMLTSLIDNVMDVKTLNKKEVNEILNWEAEKFRLLQSK